MEIGRGRTYKLQGSRMIVRRPSRKNSSGLLLRVWPQRHWWWRVSRKLVVESE